MGRRKVPMGLIPNRRLRVSRFGKRKEGLKKKASQLSVLCSVEVALVVAPAEGDGGAGADVWESKEGVLARYRELDPEVRARHTVREYLRAELGKEEAKLARVRQAGPDGLDCWDKALDGVDTVEEAQKLLDAIDAAIRAADDRRRALGMPVDDDVAGGAGVVLEEIAPLSSAPVDDDGYLLHALGGNGGDANDQAGMAIWANNGFHPCSGSAANMQYGFQQFNSSNVAAMEGYDLQMVPDMYSNGGLATDADAYHYQTRHAATMQHGYVFPCARASASASTSYFGMPSGYQMQQVVGSGAAQPNLAVSSTNEPRHGYVFPCARASASASTSYFGMPSGHQMQQVVGSGAAQPNLAVSSANEPRHAMAPVPVEYPTADTSLNYMDAKATHGVHGSGGTSLAMDARGNFINAPPAFSVAASTGGRGSNLISAPPAAPSHTMGGLAMSYGGDMTIAGRHATQSGSGMEQVPYLGDLENTQPNLWGN